MQHKQENYKKYFGGLLLVTASFLASFPAYSAGTADRSKPDPILTGGPAGSCDPGLGGADYVGGTDVNGNPVASADLPGQAVPVPGHLEIPLKSGAFVEADGKSLAPLLNPQAACAPTQPSAKTKPAR